MLNEIFHYVKQQFFNTKRSKRVLYFSEREREREFEKEKQCLKGLKITRYYNLKIIINRHYSFL